MNYNRERADFKNICWFPFAVWIPGGGPLCGWMSHRGSSNFHPFSSSSWRGAGRGWRLCCLRLAATGRSAEPTHQNAALLAAAPPPLPAPRSHPAAARPGARSPAAAAPPLPSPARRSVGRSVCLGAGRASRPHQSADRPDAQRGTPEPEVVRGASAALVAGSAPAGNTSGRERFRPELAGRGRVSQRGQGTGRTSACTRRHGRTAALAGVAAAAGRGRGRGPERGRAQHCAAPRQEAVAAGLPGAAAAGGAPTAAVRAGPAVRRGRAARREDEGTVWAGLG